MKWIKDFGDDYIVFSQGRYYEVNNAVVWREKDKNIVIRNTWTGNEVIVDTAENKTKAIKKARKICRKIDNGELKTVDDDTKPFAILHIPDNN